jgi:hypothetical protein
VTKHSYEDEANTCHTCQKGLSNHKDVLTLEWGEGDSAGQVRHGDSEVRFFCSVRCLVENFSISSLSIRA